jgi:predicted O-linked N-acetylglucosamine transferase (SPINDLY family)
MLGWLRRRAAERAGGALNERGIAHWRRGELAAAEAAFRSLLAAGEDAAAASNLGMVLLEQGREDEGLELLKRAAAAAPRDASVRNNLGVAYARGRNPAAAAEHLLAALEADPRHAEAHANLIQPLMDLCDWPRVEALLAAFAARTEREPPQQWAGFLQPYTALLLPLPETVRRETARHHAAAVARAAGTPLAPRAAPGRAGRLRIGYLSGDFHDHATAHLCCGMFERHDRSRFEVYAYSFGRNDASAYRRRIVAGCDRFVDVAAASHREAAERIAADGVQVLVDMKGFCGGSRPEILALRAAPVQLAYLGYPGLAYADFIDYTVADRVVLPEGQGAQGAEAVVRLPGSYQVNDCDQPIDAHTPARAALGLPEEGPVLCCFNHSYKIDRPIFESWLRILAAVPAAVLWLYRSNVPAKYALWKAADRAGVARSRIVFAERLPKPQHLARLRAADLFLDTHQVNAHTTASDALWAGVPLITWSGASFASRVAASLLHAVGLPELVCATQEQYEERAIALARDPAALVALRRQLEARRAHAPLYDTARTVRGLEEAYTRVWAMHLSGAPRSSFEIT